jgi:Flp pilus assembly protein TadD
LSQNAPRLRGNVADTLGWVHHLMGNQREAARLLSEAAGLEPDNAEVHLHLAVVRLAAGDLGGAAASLGRAVDLDAAMAGREEALKVEAAVKSAKKRRP